MNIKFAFLLLGISYFFGWRTYRVPQNAMEWIPYKEGDQVIFESNKQDLDTMLITDIVSFIRVKENPRDDLNQYELVMVEARVPDKWTNPMGRTFYKSSQTILLLDAHQSFTSVEFNFKPYGYYFNAKDLTFKEVLEKSQETVVTKYKTFNDVYIVQCSNEHFCNSEDGIDKLYWSKKYGLVKYVLDEVTWELKEIVAGQ